MTAEEVRAWADAAAATAPPLPAVARQLVQSLIDGPDHR